MGQTHDAIEILELDLDIMKDNGNLWLYPAANLEYGNMLRLEGKLSLFGRSVRRTLTKLVFKDQNPKKFMQNLKLLKNEPIMHLNLDYTTASTAIPSSYKHMFIKVPLTKNGVLTRVLSANSCPRRPAF